MVPVQQQQRQYEVERRYPVHQEEAEADSDPKQREDQMCDVSLLEYLRQRLKPRSENEPRLTDIS